MKLYFSGTGEACPIDQVVEHPVCPRVDESVDFPDGDHWYVRDITHTPFEPEYDVYVGVGPPRR